MAALVVCPGCGSALLQPLRSRQHPDGAMVVDLRCPECFMWMQANCSKGELAELDRAQAASREQMVDAYARSVTESMEALADCLGQAFELDLVDVDDFAPRRAA